MSQNLNNIVDRTVALFESCEAIERNGSWTTLTLEVAIEIVVADFSDDVTTMELEQWAQESIPAPYGLTRNTWLTHFMKKDQTVTFVERIGKAVRAFGLQQLIRTSADDSMRQLVTLSNGRYAQRDQIVAERICAVS